MKINEVIERHGMQLRDVSREMGMKPSALQSAIDRNLTVKTLRLISEAARIPIAEFFFDELKSDPKWVERILDELTDGERQQLLAALQPSAQPSQQPAAESRQQSQDELPFSAQLPSTAPAPLTADVAIICPHCHEAIKLGFVK